MSEKIEEKLEVLPDSEDLEGIIVKDTAKAIVLAQVIDLNVYSQDNKNNTKYHIHDSENGRILTQKKSWTGEEWEKIIKLS